MANKISSPLKNGKASFNNKKQPVTCGAAIDVPDFTSNPFSPEADLTDCPGAETSGSTTGWALSWSSGRKGTNY